MRDDVRAQAQEAQVLSAQQYVNLCQAGDHPSQRVTDPDEQNALLGLLHRIGAVVAHGLTPTTDSVAGLTLLDPNWFTSAVYALLDYGTHEFDRHDLGARLRKDPERAALYPDDRLDYIIDLLQRPEFALAFRLPGNADPPRYLLPEALPAVTPSSIAGWDAGSLRFRFRYEHLPRGLIPQFQVLSHEHTGPHPERWRAGCTLTVHGCPVLVDGKPADGVIDILVAGPEDQRRDALAVVRDLFARVHERIPESVPTARVPLPDDPGIDVAYDHLRKLEARHGPDYVYAPENADGEYRVGDLLSGVRTAQEKAREPVATPVPPPVSGSAPITIHNEVGTVGQAVTAQIAAQAPPSASGGGPEGLSRWADGAAVGTAAGAGTGALGVAVFLLGRGKGWPVEPIASGGAVGGMLGAVSGWLVLGRRRPR